MLINNLSSNSEMPMLIVSTLNQSSAGMCATYLSRSQRKTGQFSTCDEIKVSEYDSQIETS